MLWERHPEIETEALPPKKYKATAPAAANILQRHRDLAMNSLFFHHRIFIVNFEFHTFSHLVLSLTSDNEPA